MEIDTTKWSTDTIMNSMKLVIRLNSLYWSIHTKDESKRGTAFAFIFGENWLWRCGVTASFGVFFHEIKCNGMTSFMEFISCVLHFSQILVLGRVWLDLVGSQEIRKRKERGHKHFGLFNEKKVKHFLIQGITFNVFKKYITSC